MSPPPGVLLLACPRDGAKPLESDAPARLSATNGTTLVPVEAFIWEDPAKAAPATAASDEPTPERPSAAEPPEKAEPPGTTAEAMPRIFVQSEEAREPDDAWRRQFISALRDADRRSADADERSTAPRPNLPVDVPRRLPDALVARRPERRPTIASVAPLPRHRMRMAVLGIAATAGFLSAAFPRPANSPELAAANAASTPSLMVGSLASPITREDALDPVILNSPVLIREGMSPRLGPQLPIGPMIETVRTVPVQLITRPVATTPLASIQAIDAQQAPTASDRPAPAPAPHPLDRDGIAALIGDEPAPPVVAPLVPAATPAKPAPAASRESAASPPPRTDKPPKARSPQVSSAYQRSVREERRAKHASTKRGEKKTASRSSRGAGWDKRRQGLRTSPQPEEASTMVKLLKSMWPFSSKEDDAAAKGQPSRAKRNSSAPANSKNSFWWGEKDSDR